MFQQEVEQVLAEEIEEAKYLCVGKGREGSCRRGWGGRKGSSCCCCPSCSIPLLLPQETSPEQGKHMSFADKCGDAGQKHALCLPPFLPPVSGLLKPNLNQEKNYSHGAIFSRNHGEPKDLQQFPL